jgi:putative peptidoglycan lipid II flippase
MLAGAAYFAKLPVAPAFLTADANSSEFLKRFGPATLGAAGVQVAIFADTILASFLGSGSYTSLYYADRVNQLPMGVIAIALGTILLPEMSRSTHAGDAAQTARTFNRATEMGLLFTMPCLAAFVVFPEAIMQGLFARGAFNIAAANASASVLVAYSWALPAFVVLRTVTPLFHARGDTRTPVIATVIAMVCNLAVKFGLIVGLHYGVEGLALGTAVGTWINVLALSAFAWSRDLLHPDRKLLDNVFRITCATLFAGGIASLVATPLLGAIPRLSIPHLGNLTPFVYAAALSLMTFIAYGVSLLGFGWKR